MPFFLILRKIIRSFPIKCDGSCRFLVDVLCQAEEVSFYSEFSSADQHAPHRMLDGALLLLSALLPPCSSLPPALHPANPTQPVFPEPSPASPHLKNLLGSTWVPPLCPRVRTPFRGSKCSPFLFPPLLGIPVFHCLNENPSFYVFCLVFYFFRKEG